MVKVKTLIITDYFYPSINGGGGQISITNLATILSKKQDIKVICRPHDFKCKFQTKPKLTTIYQDIEIIYFSIFKFCKIISIIKNFSPTYIYFNSFFSPLTILFLVIFYNSRSRIIISPKGEFYEGALKTKNYKKKIWLCTFKKFFNTQNYTFHATSIEEKKNVQREMTLSNIVVARDIPSYYVPQPIYTTKKTTKKKIIYLSRLSEKKNLEFAIDVILQLKSEITFEIWGVVDNPAYYQKCMNKLNQSPSNITWSYNGSFPIGKSIEKFRDSDLFIFPTLGENYGYVILESLLSGCPVILSKGTTPWEELCEAGVGKNIPLSNINEWILQIEAFLTLSNIELRV